MRSGRLFLALAPFAMPLCTAAASAESGAESPRTSDGELRLTIEQTVGLGLGNNPRLGSLDLETDILAHRMRSLDWVDNPGIRVRNLAHRSDAAPFDELEIGLRWRPPAIGEARVRRQRRTVSFWEFKVEAIRERHWLASRVRRSCADVAMYSQLARLASQRIEVETLRIAQIQTMVEVGRRSIVYSTKARMAVAEARQRHLRIQHALGEEKRRLRRLTGITRPIQVISEPVPEILLAEDRLLELAFDNRPEIRLAEEQRQLALDRKSLERWRLLPQLSFIEVSRRVERSRDDWHELRFGLELPLFNRNADNLAGLSLAVSGSELGVLGARERITDEVRETLSDYTEALLARNLARREGEALIEAASRVISGTHDHATVPSDEILELERMIMDARVAITESERDLAHALYFLYYELGLEDPEVLLREPGHGE